MKVNLRKAAAIQKAINTAIMAAEGEMKTSVAVSVYAEAPDREVETAQAKFNDGYQTVTRLTEILYGIRSRVGRADAESGKNDLLTQEALASVLATRAAKYAKAEPAVSSRELNAEIEAVRTQQTSRDASIYGRREHSIATNVLPSDRIKALATEAVEAKRRKTELADRIMQINVSAEIEIPDSDYSFLRTAGVV